MSLSNYRSSNSSSSSSSSGDESETSSSSEEKEIRKRAKAGKAKATGKKKTTPKEKEEQLPELSDHDKVQFVIDINRFGGIDSPFNPVSLYNEKKDIYGKPSSSRRRQFINKLNRWRKSENRKEYNKILLDRGLTSPPTEQTSAPSPGVAFSPTTRAKLPPSGTKKQTPSVPAISKKRLPARIQKSSPSTLLSTPFLPPPCNMDSFPHTVTDQFIYGENHESIGCPQIIPFTNHKKNGNQVNGFKFIIPDQDVRWLNYEEEQPYGAWVVGDNDAVFKLPKKSYSFLFDGRAEEQAVKDANDGDERIDEDTKVERNNIISDPSQIFAYVRITFPEHVLDASIFHPDAEEDEIDGHVYHVTSKFSIEDEQGNPVNVSSTRFHLVFKISIYEEVPRKIDAKPTTKPKNKYKQQMSKLVSGMGNMQMGSSSGLLSSVLRSPPVLSATPQSTTLQTVPSPVTSTAVATNIASSVKRGAAGDIASSTAVKRSAVDMTSKPKSKPKDEGFSASGAEFRPDTTEEDSKQSLKGTSKSQRDKKKEKMLMERRAKAQAEAQARAAHAQAHAQAEEQARAAHAQAQAQAEAQARAAQAQLEAQAAPQAVAQLQAPALGQSSLQQALQQPTELVEYSRPEEHVDEPLLARDNPWGEGWNHDDDMFDDI